MAKQQPRPLTGRVVAITGGARGIGRAMEAELQRRGARVAIGDIDADDVRETAGELGVLGLPLDVTDRASFEGFLDAVETELGALDVLVNNAGIAPLRWFVDEDDAMTRRQIDVNLFGPTLGTKLAIARMRKRGTGHIVNVASSAARFAASGLATYSATKHGVLGMTQAARLELHGSGIELSVVCPGVVETEMISGTKRFRTLAAIPPEAVAEAVAGALERPRFEVWVPRSYTLLYRFNALLPHPARERLSRLFGADRMYRVDQLDDSARRRYEERLSRQSGAPGA